MAMSIRSIIGKWRKRSVSDVLRIAGTRAFQNNVYAFASRWIINEHDARLPTMPRGEDQAVASRHANGFVNLGNLGIDVDGLASAFSARVDECPQDNPSLNKINVAHPFLFHSATLKFLYARRLNDIVRAYLGEDATVDEAQLFRTPACSVNVEAPSGQWHHDGVGHVLLAWILLNDVDENSRATWYAAGSNHRPLNDNKFSRSRFTEADVRTESPNLVQLLGRKGDTVLMDPNGYHRATYEKGNKRDVFYLGFSSYAKSISLPWPGLNHGVGIVDELFPADFDATGTLVRRERLFRKGAVIEYRGNGAREELRPNRTMAVLEGDARRAAR